LRQAGAAGAFVATVGKQRAGTPPRGGERAGHDRCNERRRSRWFIRHVQKDRGRSQESRPAVVCGPR
jgi:hypothetical protein